MSNPFADAVFANRPSREPAQEAATEAITRAGDNADPAWFAEALRIVCQLAVVYPEFTTNDVNPDLVRFYRKVDPGPDGCMLWSASTGRFGYGQFWFDGKMRLAHRWIWQQVHGPLADRWAMVCHHCDRPSCVNLTHLYEGDQEQNMADRNTRGRQARLRGQANGNARLADADVPAIIARRKSGEILRTIASDYGVSIQTIHRIAYGRRMDAL